MTCTTVLGNFCQPTSSRVRFENVEALIGEVGSRIPPSIALAAAYAYMQTWSDRVDAERAGKFLGTLGDNPFHTLAAAAPECQVSRWSQTVWRTILSLEVGGVLSLKGSIYQRTERYAEAKQIFRDLAEQQTSPAVRQSCWWRYDEAGILDGLEF